MKRRKDHRLFLSYLLLLIAAFWPVRWKGLPFVSGATGKHPFRIYVSYGAGLDQNVGNPSAVQRLAQRVVVPAATTWLENLLEVPDVANSTIRVLRNCPGGNHYLINGLPYCIDNCASTTVCGEATVPESHLERCHTCDKLQRTCQPSGPTRPGVTGYDFILYVTAVSTSTCTKDQTISYAVHCQQERTLDRPIVGNLNICPKRVSYLSKDYPWQVQYVIHDLLHALAFSTSLYPFYRDSNGGPLTPRVKKTGLPPRSNNAFSWSDKIIQFKQISDWEVYNGRVNHSVAYMVTPKVKAAVRNHFKCSTLEGAPMELQKFPYLHWENRLFQGEMLSGDTSRYLVVSDITLATLEDTGWYAVDYSYAQKFTWGKGLGCNFATKSCLGYMRSQKRNGQPITPFCEKKASSSNTVTCSSDRRSIAKCNLVDHTSIPGEYQYFTGTSGFTDRSGGEDVLADYCPYYQKFPVNSQQDSRCFVDGNQPADNIALESYGASSVCLNHGRQWTKTQDGVLSSMTRTGAGCYKITCSSSQVKVEIKGNLYTCTSKGQEILVTQIVHGVTHFGSFFCPAFSDVCQGHGCISDCLGHGHCVTGVCVCDPGYYGSDCGSRYFDMLQHCNSQPCLNQGTCRNTSLSYTCSCRTGTSGQNCEVNHDECRSNPCQNGATCLDGLNRYTCQCKTGYEGIFCEKDIKECSSSPCLNGATCQEHENRYVCKCKLGFYGITCGQKVTHCPFCFNGGTCRQDNSGLCDCPIGYGGALCTVSVQYCDSNPCANGGTCSEEQGGYSCSCLSGYTGTQCETKIIPCSAGLCQNGGTCQDTLSGYQCMCKSGFTGDKCEVNINECMSRPCRNGAACEDRDSGFHCRCLPGYEGFLCEINIEECKSNPCLNDGVCQDFVNGFKCACQPGYTDLLCQRNIDDCQAVNCQNGGTCVDGVSRYHCLCPAGYSGSLCETEEDECVSSPCLNSGTCIDEVSRFRCECPSGHTGRLCELEVDECSSFPCQNGGTCRDWYANYTCDCPVGFTGAHCEVDVDDCVSQPCLNGGTCVDGSNGYTCVCSANHNGLHCETVVVDVVTKPCDSVHCKNGGTCTTMGSNHFLCFCSPGFSGLLCESEIDNCLSSPCPHSSQCVSHQFGYSCNECTSSPCLNGGQCIDKQQGFDCQCPVGFSGARCEIDLNECDPLPCLNGGRCIDGAGKYTCICTSGYEGINCEVDMDECLSQPCVNNGTCYDYVASYSCLCGLGYAGEHCEIMQQDCQKVPCLNGGTCTSMGGIQHCNCPSQYIGSRCEINLAVNECLSSPCLNGGSCIDQAGRFACVCHSGFRGAQCEENIDDCVNHLCQNGGRCVDGINSYSCLCPRQYTGQFCTNTVDPCNSSPCKNSGTCYRDGFEDYGCLCPRGFRGDDCEQPVTSVCLSVNCLNSGTCVDMQGIAVCKCRSGYSGSWCENQDSPCASSPCFNGATCRRQLNVFEGYECLCTDQFEGVRCENKRGVCTPNPCSNGGVCVENTENDIIAFSCVCQFGYMGLLCEQTLTHCDPNPCGNKGVCQPGINGGFHCICPFPYSGTSCLSKITVPSFGPSAYLSLDPILRNSGSTFGLAFSIHPERPDGLVLSTSDDAGNYIAIGLMNGKVDFRYNYGTGHDRLTSNVSLSLNQWHTVRVTHSTGREELVVDSQLTVKHVSSGGANIDFASNLVIGHQPFATDTGFYRGFIGCVSNLAINSYAIRLDSKSVVESSGVDGCSSDNQCDHVNPLCLNGGTCIHTSNDPVCACTHGYTGRRCEHSSQFLLPLFSGGSYLQLRIPRVSGKTLQVSVTVRTTHHDGLLLYMSEFPDGSGDFFAVYFSAGRVVFGFDCGSGPGWVRSTSSIPLNQHSKITVAKQGNLGSLSVDSKEVVTGQSKGPFATAGLQPTIHLGGIPPSVSLPAAMAAELRGSGYVGCISELSVNGKRLDLSSKNLDARPDGVQDCLVQSQSNLLPAFTTPSFSGNGYLEYKATPRSPAHNEWKVEFRSMALDGIVFFVGQPNDVRQGYLYLQLSGGYPQVKFDFGSGGGSVSSSTALSLRQWHRLTVSRTGNVVVLVVNSQQYSSISPGSQTIFSASDSFFLGGVPSGGNLPFPTQGLTGCVRSVQLDGSTVLALPLKAVGGRAVTECSTVNDLL